MHSPADDPHLAEAEMVSLPPEGPMDRQLAAFRRGKPLVLPPMRQVHAVLDGEPLVLHLTIEDDPIQNAHRAGRFYEAEELAEAAALLPEGAVVLDVGANIGNHSLYFARKAGARQVIPIEPNPAALPALVANVLVNRLEDRISLDFLGFGLADHAEEGLGMKRHERNLGATKMFAGVGGPLSVRRGDDVFPGLCPDLVKIDVEGMEMDVLRGLDALIARAKPILMIEVGVERFEDFAGWALDRDYLIYRHHTVSKTNDNYILLPSVHPAAQASEEENA